MLKRLSPQQSLAPLLLICGFTLATLSVPRYRTWIVIGYTILTILLIQWLLRNKGQVELYRPIAAFVLTATGVVVLRVHSYTYLDPEAAGLVRVLFAATAFGAALLFCTRWRHAATAAVVLGIVGHTVAGILLIHGDPAPRIDVWYTLQGAADALWAGENPYTQVWVSSWTVMPHFTYLPWTAILLAPGRWLAGDIRWMLLTINVLTAALVALLPVLAARRGLLPRAAEASGERTTGLPDSATAEDPRTRAHLQPLRDTAAVCAVLLLVLPGTPTQIEQAWTEPLLLACIVLALTAAIAGRRRTALVLLALALASKQHIALLLPLVAAWKWIGPRATAALCAVAGALVLPWFLADPQAFWEDTVRYVVDLTPLTFSDTLYIAAIRHLSWQPPFWCTGVIVLATLAGIGIMIRRTDPGPAHVMRWSALALMVANLVNKQAFYNQFWLVGALLLVSWAVPETLGRPVNAPARALRSVPEPWRDTQSPGRLPRIVWARHLDRATAGEVPGETP